MPLPTRYPLGYRLSTRKESTGRRQRGAGGAATAATARDRSSGGRGLGLVLLGIALVTLASGCAGSVTPREPVRVQLASDHPTRGPGTVFSTIEEAALDALAWSRENGRLADRRRLRIGTIQRRPGGYVYSAPLRSRTTVDSSAPLNVRFRLESEDVATFILHPRSGRREVDRRNESATPDERRLVDELDPRHRPIFVLTPSRKVIRYRHGEAPIFVVQRESPGTRLPSAFRSQ